MEAFLFYLFSGLAILSALCVILLSNPTRALLSLIVVMFSLAVLYLLLGAHFVAIANVIVYAGAVLVLFLFVIMLQGVGSKDVPLSKRFRPPYLLFAALTSIFFLFLLGIVTWPDALPRSAQAQGTAEAIGRLLFKSYVLPFELTSLLLLLAVFAAVALAKQEKGEKV